MTSARAFNRMLTASGKSLTQLAAITGIDRAYLKRLSTGEKRLLRSGTVIKIWIGLVFDPGHHPARPDDDPWVIRPLARGRDDGHIHRSVARASAPHAPPGPTSLRWCTHRRPCALVGPGQSARPCHQRVQPASPLQFLERANRSILFEP